MNVRLFLIKIRLKIIIPSTKDIRMNTEQSHETDSVIVLKLRVLSLEKDNLKWKRMAKNWQRRYQRAKGKL